MPLAKRFVISERLDIAVRFFFQRELFSGHRDPSDDQQRLECYVGAGVSVPGGLALAGYGMHLLLSRAGPTGADTTLWWRALGALVLLGGTSLSVACAMFLFNESRQWSRKNFSADALIASGMLLGIGVIFAGMAQGRYASREVDLGTAMSLIGLGIAILAGSFLTGLCIAFWPALPFGRKTLAGVTVEERFVLDRALVRHYDEADPLELGGSPYLAIKTASGETNEIACTRSVYELVETGDTGDVRIAHGRITGFTRHRR